MINKELINSNLVDNKYSMHFAHHKDKEEINIHIQKKGQYELVFEEEQHSNKQLFVSIWRDKFISNLEELSKNDWELHKKLIKEGHNPNEIMKIIRNDEIEKLQEISSQENFDFCQFIEPSLYERCSFINNWYVTLIDYAAFFSSIKCFKYLLMNGTNVKNTGKYAIAGGNLEIIHLCEQNHSSFKRSYETAIRFHRNDVFKYLYENKNIKIKNLAQLGRKCILYNNYEIFLFLEKMGMIINEDMVILSLNIGNLYLLRYFMKSKWISKSYQTFGKKVFAKTLFESIHSINPEPTKFLLKQKEIDINAKDFHHF